MHATAVLGTSKNRPPVHTNGSSASQAFVPEGHVRPSLAHASPMAIDEGQLEFGELPQRATSSVAPSTTTHPLEPMPGSYG